MENFERNFKGVWIPKEIWLDTNLGWSEKLLLVEIDSLDNEDHCYATNEYFAKFFNLSKDRISKIISELIKKGYIKSKLIYKKDSKQIEKRIMTTTIGYNLKQLEGGDENNDRGIVENNEDNNILDNNKFNNNNNSTFDSYFGDGKNNQKKPEFDLSFIHENIRESVKQFIDFRKASKKPFRTQEQIKTFYKLLEKYSNKSFETAKDILELSIANGWQGIFKPEQKKSSSIFYDHYGNKNG